MGEHSYLAHHGILGMHWGIRRFQNKDGSYTAAGRKRRHVDGDAPAKSYPKNKQSEETNSQQTEQPSASNAQSVALEPQDSYEPEGMSSERRKALLLAGAGVVAAATIIGVGIYKAKQEGGTETGKAFAESMKSVKVPKVNVEDDATAAKDAAAAILNARTMESKLKAFSQTENPDPKAYKSLSDAYLKALDAAEAATERKENVARFVSNNKDTILSDPKLVSKYSEFLGSKDIAAAKDHLANINNLRAERVKQAKAGAEWLGVLTATGGAINEAYKLRNTDVAKAVTGEKKK